MPASGGRRSYIAGAGHHGFSQGLGATRRMESGFEVEKLSASANLPNCID